MKNMLEELTTEVETLCATTIAAGQCACRSTWTSVVPTRIGWSTLRHTGTLTFTIPSIIPNSATEVFVFVNVKSGLSSSEVHQTLKIYTLDNAQEYAQYMHSVGYPQEAWNTNSDNMWFPMPANRRIYLQIFAAHGTSVSAELQAIGYR